MTLWITASIPTVSRLTRACLQAIAAIDDFKGHVLQRHSDLLQLWVAMGAGMDCSEVNLTNADYVGRLWWRFVGDS